MRGRWTSPDGRRSLPIALAPLDVSRLPLNLPDSPGLRQLRAGNPLTFLKLNHPWVRSPDGGSVREPLSGLSYPRLPGGSAALNVALQDRQLTHAANALDCRSRLGDAAGEGEDSVSARVTFRSPHLFSLFETADYDCGGVHSDAFNVGLILDRASGREVAVRTIWPGLTPATQKRLYFAHAGLEPDCHEALTEPPFFSQELAFTSHLTPAGLALTPVGVPLVIFACARTVTLPYADLRAYADAQSRSFADLYR